MFSTDHNCLRCEVYLPVNCRACCKDSVRSRLYRLLFCEMLVSQEDTPPSCGLIETFLFSVSRSKDRALKLQRLTLPRQCVKSLIFDHG